jgi:hypothetical protein
MPSRREKPKHGFSSFNCPRCGALAAQAFDNLSTYKGNGVNAVADPAVRHWDGSTWRQTEQGWSRSVCFACKKSALWVAQKLVFPNPDGKGDTAAPERGEDLPPIVAELYDEAVAVLPHSRRAAAALCRAAMEQLAKSLTTDLPSGVKLDGRLVALSKTVSTATLQALNIVRHVGNTALHGEKDGDESAVMYLDEDDSSIAEVFFLAINALADEMITQPRRIQDLYETLPETMRSSFEAKTAAQ